MPIRPISLYGDKILRKKAKKVKSVTPEILSLINDMFDTMHNAGGMGLASNQVGEDIAVIVLDISTVKGYESAKPIIILNPKIVNRSEETIIQEEGCLSLPGIRAKVKRPKSIKVVYNDIDMKEKVLEDNDLSARVIQHEFDHLQGVFFPERTDEETQKMLKKALNKIKNRKIEVEYPVTKKGTT
jgi:peptide deformylase